MSEAEAPCTRDPQVAGYCFNIDGEEWHRHAAPTAPPAPHAPARKGDWMQTYTGRAFWPLDPRVEDIDPVDIAHALSMICRYGGHTKFRYSVAEHCLLMSEAVAPEHALWALLHDATEAYVGDMVRPLKRSMPEYVEAEDRLMRVICDRFGLPYDFPAEVKEADNRILLDERAALMAPPPLPWHQDEASCVPLGVTVRGLSPAGARTFYLARLHELLGSR